MCRICEEDKDATIDFDYSNTDFSVGLDDENMLSISYENERTSDYTRFIINFCPMCGRKLEGVGECQS